MKILIKHIKAWDSDDAPYCWAFFGNITEEIKNIFSNVTKLTESQNTKEHVGKFYFNNIQKMWYCRDKNSVDIVIGKINEKFGKNTCRLILNTN